MESWHSTCIMKALSGVGVIPPICTRPVDNSMTLITSFPVRFQEGAPRRLVASLRRGLYAVVFEDVRNRTSCNGEAVQFLNRMGAGFCRLYCSMFLFIDSDLFTSIVNRGENVNRRAPEGVLSTLGDLPGLHVALEEAERGAEGGFGLRITSRADRTVQYSLSVLRTRSGWPADVRQAISNISDPWPRHLVVAAHSFSPGALDELRRRDANWVDAAGNIRLEVPPGLIVLRVASREGPRRKPDFSWSSSSIALAEFVLAKKIDKIILNDIADKTGWSVPQVSNVLRTFDEKEWTTRHGPPRGKGVWRELTNPGSLLEAWSHRLVENRSERKLGHRLLRDPVRFLREELAPLLDKLGDWAITGWAGLELTAPYINIVPSLQIYLPTRQFHNDATSVFQDGGITEVAEGANIEVWEMDLPLLVSSRTATGLPVANLPRLYSDLLAIGGRAKDGAEHLRETLIEY